MTPEPHFFSTLRARLVDAAEKQNRRRRNARNLFGVMAAVVVIGLAVAFGPASWNEPATASVRVESSADGFVKVSLTDRTATSAEVRQALLDRDIDATVSSEPVAPPVVGRFIYATTTDSSSVRADPSKQLGFESFEARSDAKLEIGIGRKAQDGETYATSYDATSPGGVLECVPIIGSPVRDMQPRIEEKVRHVHWIIRNQGATDKETSAPPGDFLIESARESDNQTVHIYAVDPSAPMLLSPQPHTCR